MRALAVLGMVLAAAAGCGPVIIVEPAGGGGAAAGVPHVTGPAVKPKLDPALAKRIVGRIASASAVAAKYRGRLSSLTPGDVAGAIREVEERLSDLREMRQLQSAAFENYDQKANQLMNTLSKVLKELNEMQSAIIRNVR